MFRESSHGQLGRKGGGQVVGGGGEQVGGVGEGGDGWVGQVSNLNFRTNIPSGNKSRWVLAFSPSLLGHPMYPKGTTKLRIL